jgi:hypothetical protein
MGRLSPDLSPPFTCSIGIGIADSARSEGRWFGLLGMRVVTGLPCGGDADLGGVGCGPRMNADLRG